MIWTKLGILLIGFTYAGLLPYSVKRALQHIEFDTEKQTLSFLSNKYLYGRKYLKAYKRILFGVAVLNYLFFWLLSRFYDLGEHETFMQYIDLSFAILTLLAFVPHNFFPYSLKSPGTTMQRLVHNLLAGMVFLMLPALILIFQLAILPDLRFLGISGLVIIVSVIVVTVTSILTNGLSGVSEILFINGISIWSIYVTIITLIT